MKICRTGTKLLEFLLPDVKPDMGKPYKPSIYNFVLREGGETYLFNTLSRRLVIITDEEAEILRKEQICPSDYKSECVLPLIEKRFLVLPETDEAVYYIELYTTLMAYEGSKQKGYSMFDILPTTGCNARCFYCFEAGVESLNMSLETAEEVVTFIREKRDPNKKTELSWFGGEPLLRPKIIDYICERMRQEEIPYFSTMITNGYLWTEELVRKAKDYWLLDKVQITLDGYGEEHNRRKAYCGIKEDAFTRTIKNIHMLLDEGIAVVIRFNMDSKNVDSIWEMYKFLKTEFSNKQRIVFSPAILAENWFEWSAGRTSDQQKEVRLQWRKLREDIDDSGFSRFAALSNTLPRTHCMANSGASVTIQPDGKLYMCQTGNASMLYGNVAEGITKPEIVEQWSCNTKVREMCKHCTWLPECTAFSMCPALPSDCDIEMEDKVILRLKKTIRTLNQKATDEQ